MACPLDYSLCRDRVTVYRKVSSGILRTVFDNAFLQVQDKLLEDSHGPQLERAFLLVLPGSVSILPGDRVILGEGPAVNTADWAAFIPANVQGLCQVQYVQPCYFMGSICHTEAGRKASTFYQ